MHESFPDPLSRCTAVAAEVISRWQASGKAISPNPPSMLLVNAGPQEPDPIWQLIGKYRGSENLAPTGEDALKAIRAWVDKRNSFRSRSLSIDEANDALMKCLNDKTRQSGNAHAMWNPPLEPAAEFLAACQNGPGKVDQSLSGEVRGPEIPGGRPHPVSNLEVFSGSIDAASWSWELLHEVLNHELPVLFLPHAASSNSPLQGRLGALHTSGCLQHEAPRDVQTVNLPPWQESPWLRRIESEMMYRTQALPLDYQFFLHRTIRQLVPVCSSIAARTGEDGISVNVATLMASDLLQMTAWAIVAGAINLSWHGWGSDDLRFPPLKLGRGQPSRELCKFLETVRKCESISIDALYRKAGKLPIGESNRAVEILCFHGHLDSGLKKFTPRPLGSYLESFGWRACLPSLNLLTTPYYRQMKGGRTPAERKEAGKR
jgi:hypothetical protein